MKKILILFILFLSFIAQSGFSQITKFRRVIGNTGYDYGKSVQQTFDKGYIIGGTTTSIGSGATDMYMVKTDSMGIPKIHKAIGGINIEGGVSVRQTSDSGYIFLGYTNSYGAGGYDFYVVKTDSLLLTQWTKTYGGSDWEFGTCIEQTSDGGYIMCGSTFSYGHGDQDYYLIKTNALGDTLWTKTYGGTKEDIAKSVVQTSDGGYILTGTTKSMGDTLGDIYTVKTDAAGDTTWTRRYNSVGLHADYGNDILESAYGGYVVGGEFYNGAMGQDGIVIRYSTLGAVLNFSTIGSTNYDGFNSICEAANGNIHMVGLTDNWGAIGGDIYGFIVKSDFNYFNSTTYGTLDLDEGFSTENTADNGFIICGTTNGFNNGLGDIYLIKADTNGLSGLPNSETFLVTNIQNNEEMEEGFSIYPNPAMNYAYLNFNTNTTSQKLTVMITDVLGKEMEHFELETNAPYFLKTDAMKNGIYFITSQSEKGSSTKKLVIYH